MYRNPNEEASEEKKKHAERYSSAVKTSANFAIGGTLAGAFGGSQIAQKVLPFLSKFIPQNLMLKALHKIDPRISKFADNALKTGNDIEEVRDFIGNKLQAKPPKTPKEEQTQDNRNIIEQYSPQLKQFIEDQIAQGRSPLEAGALAQNSSQFSQIIKKLSLDHKAPWSAILESIYGGAGQAQPQQNQQSQQQQPQQQNGQGIDPQLAQIMQGLTGEIKKLRGR